MEPLCRLDQLTEGQVRLCERASGVVPASLLVLREGDAVRGFANVCPHFGVPLARKQEHLIFKPGESMTCNTHYARFRWSDGFCVFGDCEGESLTPVTLVVEDGVVGIVADQASASR